MSRKRRPLDRFLRAFADVRAEEGATTVLLLINIFLLLSAYYLVKPVREGWLAVSVVQGMSPVEVKAVSAFGQAILLLILLPVYARIASRWSRRQLLTRSALFFGAALMSFYFLQPTSLLGPVPYAGILFYLFVGIFNVTMVAQFWAFAADVYGEERGRRLFPLVGIGAAAGAALGSIIGEKLVTTGWVGPFELIPISLVPLAVATLITRRIDARGTYGRPSEWTRQRWDQAAAPNNEGPFKPIFGQPYLASAALLILIFNWVLTSGDIILFGYIQQTLQSQYDGTENLQQFLQTQTTAFYSDLYFWVNVFGLLLQAFVVSRLVKFGGFGLLILTTPVIAVAAYTSMLIAPVLAVIKFMKIAEISSSHSINNTARQMLWLRTTKAVLYQTKTAVDTLFVRLGDGLAALVFLFGTRFAGVGLEAFLLLNVALAILWAFAARHVLRHYQSLERH